MSHGITDNDRGVVWGETWHGLPQYITQDSPVTPLQARLVLDYPVALRRLYAPDPDDPTVFHMVDACCVVRTDTDQVLVPHVGLRFRPLNNRLLVDVLEARLLTQNPDLVIESVGTLFGGATAFINIVLERYHIKGDDSETLTRLLYYNPMGIGGYRVGVHNIRVVCNNTLRLAKAQAKANQTLTMIPHTEAAAQAIADKLFELSGILSAAKEFRGGVESLATVPIRGKEELDKLLALIFPSPDDEEPDYASKRDVLTYQEKLRERAAKIFDAGVDGIQTAYQRTRYSLLQACTYVVDHPETIRTGNDMGYVMWDGMVGDRAGQKEHFLTILLDAK